MSFLRRIRYGEGGLIEPLRRLVWTPVVGNLSTIELIGHEMLCIGARLYVGPPHPNNGGAYTEGFGWTIEVRQP